MYPFLVIGEIKIQTYFLIIAALAVISFYWVYLKSKKQHLNQVFMLDLTLVLSVSGFVFARLFHVIYESPELYWNQPVQIFYFWNGGFVFLGGFLGALLSGIFFVFIKNKKNMILYLCDFYSPLIAFDYAVGRIGCFMAGCCYGKFCNLPWAIEEKHPTQLYAFVWDIILFAILQLLPKLNGWQKKNCGKDGRIFSVFLIFHGVGRIINESFRADFRGPIFLLPLSTWLSLTMILASIILIIKNKET
ncbi:MAG: prolipoprotein diacylglyceryl transferase [Bdellovibrionaceae bacterium]|nr:prolipoprotein diacylglyceryl transferase [Pseudobdellovibrionaceae bacterium]NUM57098.1 prolipoprotein diacylglyceryl transferase [Pseudobdellovibrionaceae bacterium]